MSKLVLFRGKTRKNGEALVGKAHSISGNWVYGGISYQNGDNDFTIKQQQDPKIQGLSVYAETVGQYTGKDDKYGQRIYDDDIITYETDFNGNAIHCKGNVFYSGFLAAYMVTLESDDPHNLDETGDLDLNLDTALLSECTNIVVIGNTYDGECEPSEKVKNTPFDAFLSIASDIDKLWFDIDPYGYLDDKSEINIQYIAEQLLYTSLRNAFIDQLQKEIDYFTVGNGKGYDYVKIVERSKNLIKRISEFNENPQ